MEVLPEFLKIGQACESPIAVQAETIAAGSTDVVHATLANGFWCLNREQPGGEMCADFKIRFCCEKVSFY